MKKIIIPLDNTSNIQGICFMPPLNKEISNVRAIAKRYNAGLVKRRTAIALFVFSHNARPVSTKAAGGVA